MYESSRTAQRQVMARAVRKDYLKHRFLMACIHVRVQSPYLVFTHFPTFGIDITTFGTNFPTFGTNFPTFGTHIPTFVTLSKM